ncbi:Mut7-C RNAse domain-containing protein [Gracilimonas sp.]|uniref:Mut7-C RNAse domain-containing protein n=1 Tax=Gracilimonas sp. TaxID=1974203 RepID=UPI003752C549
MRFNLNDKTQSFTRCPACNGTLEQVAKDEILNQLEPLTKEYYDHFSSCPKRPNLLGRFAP